MTNKTNSADHAYPIFFIYDISLDPGRRSMSIFSKSIRKKILAQHLDVELESLRFSKGAHGKPILKGKSDLHFNISHTDNYWIMALSKEDEIGIFLLKKYRGTALVPILQFEPASAIMNTLCSDM